MIAHQFCKYFSKRKDVSHDVYFCDMKAKDFIEILSNTGYSVYIKRNEKDGYITKEISELLEDTCNKEDTCIKTVVLAFIWILIKAKGIKPFYTTSGSSIAKEYINKKIDEWISEIYPIVKNIKIGDNEIINKEIFRILRISEQVLPKALVHTYQKVISDKLIKLENKK